MTGKMFTGLIIKEGLQPDTNLEEFGLKIVKTKEWKVGKRAAEFQPKIWNAIYVEGAEKSIGSVADALARVLLPKWYANFSDATTEYVVFQGKVFKHRKGDKEDAMEAMEYGRSLGLPDHQLDWVK